MLTEYNQIERPGNCLLKVRENACPLTFIFDLFIIFFLVNIGCILDCLAAKGTGVLHIKFAHACHVSLVGLLRLAMDDTL